MWATTIEQTFRDVADPHSNFIVSGTPANKLAEWVNEPNFLLYIQQFLAKDSSIDNVQAFNPLISVFTSAATTFYTPSDPRGAGGMPSKRIHAVERWKGSSPRYDCVFITKDLSPAPPTDMKDLHVVHLLLLFSFSYHQTTHRCALIRLLPFTEDEPDSDTGMQIVESLLNQAPQVVPLNLIYRAAHLIPVYHGISTLSRSMLMATSLDKFCYYYINKFIDHHAFEILHE